MINYPETRDFLKFYLLFFHLPIKCDLQLQVCFFSFLFWQLSSPSYILQLNFQVIPSTTHPPTHPAYLIHQSNDFEEEDNEEGGGGGGG